MFHTCQVDDVNRLTVTAGTVIFAHWEDEDDDVQGDWIPEETNRREVAVYRPEVWESYREV